MSKERRKHSPDFKAKVAVEAVKGRGDDSSTKNGRLWAVCHAGVDYPTRVPSSLRCQWRRQNVPLGRGNGGPPKRTRTGL